MRLVRIETDKGWFTYRPISVAIVDVMRHGVIIGQLKPDLENGTGRPCQQNLKIEFYDQSLVTGGGGELGKCAALWYHVINLLKMRKRQKLAMKLFQGHPSITKS